jgi:hypothetical protein
MIYHYCRHIFIESVMVTKTGFYVVFILPPLAFLRRTRVFCFYDYIGRAVSVTSNVWLH